MTEFAPEGTNQWSSNTPEEAAARAQVLLQFANELIEATETLNPIAPLRDRIDEMTVADAYQVQESQLRRGVKAGRVLAGRKVGLTSFAMQEQLGVDSPDFGYFFEDMAYEDGAEIPADSFVSPKVEPEVAVVLKKTLQGPNVTLEEAREAVEGVYPAIEIIDSRIVDWDIKLVDTIADNASCGAIAMAKTPIDIPLEQLDGLACSLLINGEEKESGVGKAVMDDPMAPLAWLANTLATQGVALEAGQIVLTGSFTKALPVIAGESATADFGEHGRVSINFS